MKILIRALKPFRLLLPALLGATFCCAAGALVRIWYAQSVSDFIDGAMNGSVSVNALAWAAGLAYDNEARLFAVGRDLYAPIAQRFGATEAAVERLIRHAVESTMDSVGADGIYGFFGNTIDPTRGKPTNAQMIAMLVQRMRVM